MKQLTISLFFAGSLFLLSCNDQPKTENEESMAKESSVQDQNLAINDSIMAAYEAGTFDQMDKWLTEDAVDHGGENGDIKGRDSIVSEMKRYHAMMPDMKANMTKSAATGDYVFTWSETEGTMNGSKMKMKGVDVTRFENGKAAEHWIYMDPKDMMSMMGPQPEQK